MSSFLVGCGIASGPPLVGVGPSGVQLHTEGGSSANIGWKGITRLKVDAHPLSENMNSAPVLVVSTDGGTQIQVCSIYPRRIDPRTYAGMYTRISVDKASFEKIQQAIITGAGLVPDGQTGNSWKAGGTPAAVPEAQFPHAFSSTP